MKSLIRKYRSHFGNSLFLISFISACIFLIGSLFINFYAGIYATKNASNSVTDVILSNIRVFDVDGIFVYGSLALWLFISFLGLTEPKRIPFMVKSTALFVLIRSVFISLTHIGPFPTAIIVNSSIIKYFAFGADLFFSGHTGLPFLMALIFWRNKALRLVFMGSSIVFAVVVLLGHLHYSIDVLSAFFITYTIYHASSIFFKSDKQMFGSGIK